MSAEREGSNERGHKLTQLCIERALPSGARHVLLALKNYEGKDLIASPSVDRIAHDCAMQRRTVSAALTQLTKSDLIEVMVPRRGGASAQYRLIDTSGLPRRTFGTLPTRWSPKTMGTQTHHGEDPTMGTQTHHGEDPTMGTQTHHGEDPTMGTQTHHGEDPTMGTQTHRHGVPNAPAMGCQTHPKDGLKDGLKKSLAVGEPPAEKNFDHPPGEGLGDPEPEPRPGGRGEQKALLGRTEPTRPAPARVRRTPDRKKAAKTVTDRKYTFDLSALAKAFTSGAQERGALGALDKSLFTRLWAVVAALEEHQRDLSHVRLAGEYMRAHPYVSPVGAIGWDTIARGGWLLSRIDAAVQWDAAGRKSDRKQAPPQMPPRAPYKKDAFKDVLARDTAMRGARGSGQ
jgi:hypothetical protein